LSNWPDEEKMDEVRESKVESESEESKEEVEFVS